ncbi:helix-turn-helix transcriptional regulator [Bordetella hinzii]|uniref:helix-turn-helix transcriptional regulator n=1 Tax=Bordetella hinzii TaxID=103855 RepID=UPI00114EEB33|nr:transcriptional regulator [Bordetella hinzii]QDJ57292.1 hypothetical protein CBR72_21955 [Bordetella hinzii]
MNVTHTAAAGRAFTGRGPVDAIRPEGLYRWKEFADRIPYSRETWRQRVNAGTAPKPAQQTGACTAWRGQDLLDWLADPMGYKAPSPETA